MRVVIWKLTVPFGQLSAELYVLHVLCLIVTICCHGTLQGMYHVQISESGSGLFPLLLGVSFCLASFAFYSAVVLPLSNHRQGTLEFPLTTKSGGIEYPPDGVFCWSLLAR